MRATLESPESARSIRVVLADDHPIVLAGLAQLFASERGFEVLACARNGEEALAAVLQHDPDVLVLDLRMPKLGGLAVLDALARNGARTRVVILTATESDQVLDAIRRDVPGVVLKEAIPEQLIRCVREVYSGRRWIEPSLAARALKMLSRHASEQRLAATLTQRELQVARLIAEGHSNKAVAAKLGISEGTIKLHLHHAYEKLDVNGRLALALYLRERGLA